MAIPFSSLISGAGKLAGSPGMGNLLSALGLGSGSTQKTNVAVSQTNNTAVTASVNPVIALVTGESRLATETPSNFTTSPYQAGAPASATSNETPNDIFPGFSSPSYLPDGGFSQVPSDFGLATAGVSSFGGDLLSYAPFLLIGGAILYFFMNK